MYKLIEDSSITVCDVDKTLVDWGKDYRNKGDGKIEFDYGSEKVYLVPHGFHPIFLKHCYNRNDLVIVWSNNGAGWAEQVVKKLGLENHVSIIMGKPSRHIDDKTELSEIVGSRVYIEDKSWDKE